MGAIQDIAKSSQTGIVLNADAASIPNIKPQAARSALLKSAEFSSEHDVAFLADYRDLDPSHTRGMILKPASAQKILESHPVTSYACDGTATTAQLHKDIDNLCGDGKLQCIQIPDPWMILRARPRYLRPEHQRLEIGRR